MRPETEVLHRGEGAREGASPLNTPIYATSTFVFANAAELEAFNQGKSNKYLYTRYGNPTVQAVEEKLAVLEGARSRDGDLVGHGGDVDGVLRPVAGGR